MRKIGSILIAGVIWVGCGSPEKVKVDTPAIKLPNADEIVNDVLSGLKTCNRPDSELNLEQFGSQDRMVIRDRIETREIIEIGCDQKRKSRGKQPVRGFDQILNVEAPSDLAAEVSFVRVENLRTCADVAVDATEDSNFEDQIIEIPGQEPMRIPSLDMTMLGRSGKLKVQISDSDLKLGHSLNLRDHSNVIRIKYFGKCTRYKDKVDPKAGESSNCAEAELLAERQFALQLQIERPEITEPLEKNVCVKP